MEIDQPFSPSLPRNHIPWAILPLDQNSSRSIRLCSCFSWSSNPALVPSELLLIYKYLVIKTYNMIGNTSCIDSSEQAIQLTLFFLRFQKDFQYLKDTFYTPLFKRTSLGFTLKEKLYLLSEDKQSIQILLILLPITGLLSVQLHLTYLFILIYPGCNQVDSGFPFYRNQDNHCPQIF